LREFLSADPRWLDWETQGGGAMANCIARCNVGIIIRPVITDDGYGAHSSLSNQNIIKKLNVNAIGRPVGSELNSGVKIGCPPALSGSPGPSPFCELGRPRVVKWPLMEKSVGLVVGQLRCEGLSLIRGQCCG
jgi:hypothetical protein